MAVSGTTWISYYDEESQTWISGQIYADDNGHLTKVGTSILALVRQNITVTIISHTVKNFYRTAMYCIILMKAVIV